MMWERLGRGKPSVVVDESSGGLRVCQINLQGAARFAAAADDAWSLCFGRRLLPAEHARTHTRTTWEAVFLGESVADMSRYAFLT